MQSPIEHRETVHPEQIGWEGNIELDDGNPWQVERRTTEGIQQMSQILKDDASNTVKEYRQLGEQLEGEKSNVESRRTNDGAPNINLDIYLESLDEKDQRVTGS